MQIKCNKNINPKDFPGDPLVKTVLPLQGVHIPSLFEELRSLTLPSVTKNLSKLKKILNYTPRPKKKKKNSK